MAKKLIHAVLAVITLVFCVFAFTQFFNDVDSTLNVDSGVLTDGMSDLSGNLTPVNDNLERQIVLRVDNTSSLIPDTATDQEDRAADAFGVSNILTKNILVNFLTTASNKLNIPPILTNFILSLMGITIIFLFIRALWGESKT